MTIQGSQIVDGTDRRELFTETLKTKLIFDNGAAIELKARVVPGQSLFLRNELSGREILCRVIEAPPPGQTGCTDLEFTIHDPEFWSAKGEPLAPAADVVENTEPQEAIPAAPPAMESAAESAGETATTAPASTPGIEPPVESSVPVESSAPADAANPATPAETPAGFSPVPEELVPAFEAAAPPAQPDDAKEAEQLAGILARYARAIAKRASEKSAASEAQQQLAADAAQPLADATTRKQKAFSTLAFRLHGIRELTVKKNPIALGVVACIVIASALGVAWDVTRMVYPEGFRPTVGWVRTKPLTPRANAGASKTASAKAGKPEALPTKPGPKIQPPSVAQVPAARIAKSPAATTKNAGAARGGKPIESAAAPVVYREEVNPSVPTADLEPSAQPRPRKGEPSAPQLIPAKILSQYQPPLPKWAQDLDLGGVVTLDAVVDEKGNLRQMKLLSGPRVLESAAEAAVGLWIFQPALADGKPTATHMVLTVEFQR